MYTKKNTILVVDHRPQIQKMISSILIPEGFKLVESDSGQQAIRLCASIKPDLVLLALGLTDMDGKDVISSIRQWSQVPIIVISARLSDNEIVAALNMGANDYVTKPFSGEVLIARINASLRSCVVQEVGEPQLNNGPLRIDLVRHEVFINNKLCPLTPKEYDLLRYFMVNIGKMLTHKEVLKEVWGEAHREDTTYLRVYIGQIRDKIEKDPSGPSFITTLPGVGYRMESLESGEKPQSKSELFRMASYK